MEAIAIAKPNAVAMSPDQIRDLVCDALDDLKAQEVTVLDVNKKTSFADWMVIVTGTSQRHVKSLANHVIEKSKESGHRPLGLEGETDGNWILVDLGDVIVHVMTRESRDFYALEKLWGDVTAGDVSGGTVTDSSSRAVS